MSSSCSSHVSPGPWLFAVWWLSYSLSISGFHLFPDDWLFNCEESCKQEQPENQCILIFIITCYSEAAKQNRPTSAQSSSKAN